MAQYLSDKTEKGEEKDKAENTTSCLKNMK